MESIANPISSLFRICWSCVCWVFKLLTKVVNSESTIETLSFDKLKNFLITLNIAVGCGWRRWRRRFFLCETKRVLNARALVDDNSSILFLSLIHNAERRVWTRTLSNRMMTIAFPVSASVGGTRHLFMVAANDVFNFVSHQ